MSRHLLVLMNRSVQRLGKDFYFFLVGELLTLLCIGIWHVTLSWWIATQGGAQDLALYGVALSASSIVFTFVLSPLGDRYNKRNVILYARAALLVSGLALASMCSEGHYQIWHIVGAVIAGSAAMAVVLPACAAVPADVVPVECLPQALSIQKSVQAIGRTIGPAIAGFILATTDVAIGLWSMTVLGILSAISTIAVSRNAIADPTNLSSGSWASELSVGIKAKWTIPIERYWSLLSLIFFATFLPATGMLLPLLVQHRGMTGGWYGLIDMAYASGMVFGFIWLTGTLNFRWGKALASTIGMCSTGIALMMTGIAENAEAYIFCFLVVGAGFAVHNLNGQTHRTMAIPRSYRTRLLAINVMLYQVSSGLGAAITGWLLARYSLSYLYVGYGAVIMLVGLSFLHIPGYRQFMAMHHEDIEGYYGETYPEIFREYLGKQV